jgi:N-hydroxyarylamine O-acetyltransferase
VQEHVADADQVRQSTAVALHPELTEAVLTKLGLDDRPDTDLAGLNDVYAAWCRRVPFDNIVKRIHLVSRSDDPFPNGPSEAFLRRWLRDGTGGTCWPSSAGLHAFLVALGFDARRGSAAMYDNLSGPIHTHGTTIVRVDGVDHWVDSSMLTYKALPLVAHESSRHDDPVSPVWAEPVDDLWRVWWTSAADGSEIGCLLLDDDASAEHYLVRYEASRGMSPFNTMLYATRNTDDARISLAMGRRFERGPESITSAPLAGDDRVKALIEEFGYSEAIVAQLPADEVPTSPE